MTEYGWTRTGTVVHLVDNPTPGMPSRARCGVEVDKILAPASESQGSSRAVATCANCNAVLPLRRYYAGR